MASYQIAPPEKFDFHQPDTWPKWIRRFERYSQASGLAAKGDESQVNALVYCMGEEADDIMSSFGLSDEDSKKFETVKTKFEAHFVKKRNVVYERAKFNLRKQEEGELVDSFITSLYKLAEHCNYGNLRDDLIRDRIVIGVRDTKLSLKLQLEDALTLEKAISLARQNESLKQQQTVIRHEEPVSESVERVRTKQPKQRSREAPTAKYQTTACTRCGRAPTHPPSQCPARSAECHRCHKRGHFQGCCRSKVVQEVHTNPDSDDSFFLGAVGDSSISDNNPWMVRLKLNNVHTRFKIDTGADVSVVPESLFKKLKGVTLQATSKKLHGAGGKRLTVKGKFTATLRHKKRRAAEEVYVISGLTNPLLGLPAIESLRLLSRICTIDAESSQVMAEHPKLFRGLGSIDGEYRIELEPDSRPFALSTPRRVAIPLMPKVKEELENMERAGIISKVEQPTDWCAGMVVVPKGNGKVRICVDLTKLNQSVKRERHVLPSVDQSLAQLGGATVFSKLDANSGFWQVKLAPQSALLTTFITPVGRFCFNHLPFGITSAPEYFQRQMSTILSGLEGTVCLMDDILVHGKTRSEHDKRLAKVLEKLEEAGITLNKEKCEFAKSRVKFLGHIVDSDGVRADPDKVRAIQEMPPPSSVGEVRRFLGMVNQLSKFSPKLADLSQPLRALLSKKNTWAWTEAHRKAFEDMKEELSSDRVLALYHPDRDTVVSSDASSYGLGGVLLQQQTNGEWRPVMYSSRTLTETEQRYAQIEKEALGVTWACERFKDFLLGKQFHIHTDHKPLVPLLSHKNLDELTVRLQRFRMRLMRYQFTISHVAGKDLVLADTLSRAPVQDRRPEDAQLERETNAFVYQVLEGLPATESRLQEIKDRQQDDAICKQVISFCEHGWPPKSQVEGPVKKFYSVSAELSVEDGLLLRGSRIVIPSSLQTDMLKRIHKGHQGIGKCRERARHSVWWPGLNSQLENPCFQLRGVPKGTIATL